MSHGDPSQPEEYDNGWRLRFAPRLAGHYLVCTCTPPDAPNGRHLIQFERLTERFELATNPKDQAWTLTYAACPNCKTMLVRLDERQE